jgi:transcriptional regulator with XRE-family HTH domain
MLSGTKADWGAWRKLNGFAKIGAEAWAANMVAQRRIVGKVDPEMARVIKTSAESGAELARRFDVSKSTVSKIRLGKTWAETIPQASVFTWRG